MTLTAITDYVRPRVFHLRHHQLDRLREAVFTEIAWALPRNVAYWAAIRVLAEATTGPWSNTVVPELRATEALERWRTSPADKQPLMWPRFRAYRGHPDARKAPVGVHRYPSGIGWYLALPGRAQPFLAFHVRHPRPLVSAAGVA